MNGKLKMKQAVPIEVELAKHLCQMINIFYNGKETHANINRN